MTNKFHSTLYIGVTSDLRKRVYEHKNSIFPDSFTSKYKLHKLVYVEGFHRDRRCNIKLKGGSRNKKIELITSLNLSWKDLYEDVLLW